MNCPNCGQEIVGDDKFCNNCGAPLQAQGEEAAAEEAMQAVGDDAAADTEAPPAEMEAPASGPVDVSQEDHPVLEAIEPVAPDLSESPPLPVEAPAKKRKTGLIIAIVVVAVLLLCCCIATIVLFTQADVINVFLEELNSSVPY